MFPHFLYYVPFAVESHRRTAVQGSLSYNNLPVLLPRSQRPCPNAKPPTRAKDTAKILKNVGFVPPRKLNIFNHIKIRA